MIVISIICIRGPPAPARGLRIARRPAALRQNPLLWLAVDGQGAAAAAAAAWRPARCGRLAARRHPQGGDGGAARRVGVSLLSACRARGASLRCGDSVAMQNGWRYLDNGSAKV
eukprot:COSAG01_NODE_3316_length_6272_cov_4.305376_2_plen_114_part_00